MELRRLVESVDWGDAAETVVGVVIVLAYITGNVATDDWLTTVIVVSAAAAIFGDKVYKYFRNNQ